MASMNTAQESSADNQPTILNCKQCGEEFVKGRRRVFCSYDCKTKNSTAKKIRKYHDILESKFSPKELADILECVLCLTCMKRIHVFGSWPYCSKECRKIWKDRMQSSHHNRKCRNCGARIERKGHVSFCSHECRKEYPVRVRRSKSKFRAFTIGTCLTCSKKIEDPAQRTYCSAECRVLYTDYIRDLKIFMRQKRVKKCSRCGTVLKGRSKWYCSPECRIQHNARRQLAMLRSS